MDRYKTYPFVEIVLTNPKPSLYETIEFHAGAATEGRPYKKCLSDLLREIQMQPVCISISPFGHKVLPSNVTLTL
jgi:hypothetical protein